MVTSEAARIFSWSFDKTFICWKLTHQTSPCTMLSAPFAGMEGTQVDNSWLFTNDEPDHSGVSQTSLDATAGGGAVQAKPP